MNQQVHDEEGIELRLRELGPQLAAGVNSQLGAVAVAIAVEDAFDLVLTDDEINPHRLGSVDSIRELVLSRRSVT